MSEDLNQNISQFMDNELRHADALLLLATLNAQPELQHKLKRYVAISHALKSGVYLEVKADFLDHITQQIQQEPVLVAVLEKPVAFKQAYPWLVLAASLAIIALVTEQRFNSQLIIPAATLQMAQRWLPEQSDLNKRISLYLKEHRSDAYVPSENAAKPY